MVRNQSFGKIFFFTLYYKKEIVRVEGFQPMGTIYICTMLYGDPFQDMSLKKKKKKSISTERQVIRSSK